ncbi:Ferric uptake regulator family protein/ fur family [Synechococcus sp. PROS-7-1]|nr:Ferric uptake regulator family protein/ fur family [Synechococcus sp. PROS-7-1]
MVLDLLWSEGTHLSARDIFEKLNQRGRSIGHTSVYQNLEALQSAGVIECLDRASGRLYGYRNDPHSHITCMESGAIEDLDVELPPALLQDIEQRTGYQDRVLHPSAQWSSCRDHWRILKRTVTLTPVGSRAEHRERSGQGDSPFRSRPSR